MSGSQDNIPNGGPEGSIFLPQKAQDVLNAVTDPRDVETLDLCNLLGRGAFAGLTVPEQSEVHRQLEGHRQRFAPLVAAKTLHIVQ